jgi:hypothetical protein
VSSHVEDRRNELTLERQTPFTPLDLSGYFFGLLLKMIGRDDPPCTGKSPGRTHKGPLSTRATLCVLSRLALQQHFLADQPVFRGTFEPRSY